MIVPQYWAEGRARSTLDGRQVTVRRWGWSDQDPASAQAHADSRAQAAFDRIAAGEPLPRRERKVAYNGADGVPIREEIVERHGDCVVTRNAYGARCLNTPDVLFVDVDFEPEWDINRGGPRGGDAGAMRPARAGGRLAGAALMALLVGGIVAWLSKGVAPALIAAAFVFVTGLLRVRKATRSRLDAPLSSGNNAPAPALPPHEQMLARLEAFTTAHPDWHLRLYRTPAGFRVLVMHDVFVPSEERVTDCFRSLGADAVYARMCRNQNCFRARVSAKPWRIEVWDHILPKGVWPIQPAFAGKRSAWVTRYERAAKDYAACEFIGALGDAARVHPSAQAVQVVHDELSRAASGLPIA